MLHKFILKSQCLRITCNIFVIKNVEILNYIWWVHHNNFSYIKQFEN